jgi:hypothetical protein
MFFPKHLFLKAYFYVMGVGVSNPEEKLRKELLERLEKLKGEIERLRLEWEEVKQIGRRRS